jgi:hypothetical protein
VVVTLPVSGNTMVSLAIANIESIPDG